MYYVNRQHSAEERESLFNYNNFTKVDGIFTDGHPPQIIDGLKQTNIDIAGGNLQPARPVKVIIFNKLVVRSQDLSVSDIR